MNKNRKHKIFIFAIFLISPLLARADSSAMAEESLTLSLTPPLFQIAVSPGDVWVSNLKIVNVNSYDLTLHANAMDFEAMGEEGGSAFIPNSGTTGPTYSLSQWIDVSREPILVPREASVELPFTIRVPETAEPGGHYAAILVGAEPPRESGHGANVSVSSYVSSLILLKVTGEVRESGAIREFSTPHGWYDKPNVPFTLRFQNTGNVHLQPQGEIVIRDARDRERGRMKIYYGNDFGNVLPGSVRKFNFEWKGNGGIGDSGRYKAEVTLGFGRNEKNHVTNSIYFWVVPVAPILGIIGSILFVALCGAMLIRIYIRRTIARYELGRFYPRRDCISGNNLLGDIKRLEIMLVDGE